jgi:hypothetical protein
MNKTFRIHRVSEPGQYSLSDVFTDIQTYEVLHSIFADAEEIDGVLRNTRLFVADRPGFMFVDNDDASITIGLNHLRQSPDEILYLDIIHELCHVKQHLQGRNLYDRSKSYVDRETEIEAYRITIQEARRIGLNEDDITRYLHVSWITPEEHMRLVHRLDIRGGIPEDRAQGS